MGAAEYARPNTGARITRRNSANGALPITGAHITRGNNANSMLPIRAPENGENKNLPAPTVRFDFNQCHHAVLSVDFVAPIFTDN